MAFNGLGGFNRLFSWVSDANAGIAISPTKFDQDGVDVAAALSNTICRDGQSTIAADIPWNGKKITGLGAPTNTGDAVPLRTLLASQVATLLGFAPVQQGTGAGQLTANAVKLGWDGTSKLLASVDSSALGQVWTDAVSTFVKSTTGYLILPNGFIVQWNTASITADAAITYPLAFPGACLGVFTNFVGNPTTQMFVSNADGITSKTGFALRCRYYAGTGSPGALPGGSYTFNYLAIGY